VTASAFLEPSLASCQPDIVHLQLLGFAALFQPVGGELMSSFYSDLRAEENTLRIVLNNEMPRFGSWYIATRKRHE
jgi:hypothetical protein